MANKGGGGGGEGLVLLSLGAAFVGLAYLTRGRGAEDSPHVPNLIEDQIDFVVKALNEEFGHAWVNQRLDELQAHIESKFPQVALLVSLLYAAERQYAADKQYMYIPQAGPYKKQVALQMVHWIRASNN